MRLGEEVGRGEVIRIAERLGITSALRDDPSLALGSSEVRLLELTGAYASIANGGRLVWPEAIERDRGRRATSCSTAAAPVDEPVLEPVDGARDAGDARDRARGAAPAAQAALRRFVAGKTGTSSENRDAWFVGFTDQLVVGVWVGNDDGRPMPGVTGGGLPALIFRDFILRAQGDDAVPARRRRRPSRARRRWSTRSATWSPTWSARSRAGSTDYGRNCST